MTLPPAIRSRFRRTDHPRSHPHEVFNCLLHLLDISPRIDARAMGPFVQDSNHRDWIAVLNAGGQIEFTGHSHYRLRSLFNDDPSRQGPSGGYGDIDLILIGYLDQFLDFALPTTLAVFDIARDLDRTVKILNAMWKENQQPPGPGSMIFGADQMIVQFDKGLLHLDL